MDKTKVIIINMEAQGNNILSIKMNDDGSIVRSGNGTEDIDNNVFIGIIDPNLFDILSNFISKNLMSFFGNEYAGKEKNGLPCSIEISIASETEIKIAKFNYWSESPGLPKEAREVVMMALQLTDSWYNKNLKKLNPPIKKWFEFWK